MKYIFITASLLGLVYSGWIISEQHTTIVYQKKQIRNLIFTHDSLLIRWPKPDTNFKQRHFLVTYSFYNDCGNNNGFGHFTYSGINYPSVKEIKKHAKQQLNECCTKQGIVVQGISEISSKDFYSFNN